MFYGWRHSNEGLEQLRCLVSIMEVMVRLWWELNQEPNNETFFRMLQETGALRAHIIDIIYIRHIGCNSNKPYSAIENAYIIFIKTYTDKNSLYLKKHSTSPWHKFI